MTLDPVAFISPGSLGAAIETTVASIASPTELNSLGTAQGEIRLARTTEAGTGNQTWYYLDTTSDAQSLPYIVTSATAGLKWIAFGGRYNNQALSLASTLAVTGAVTLTVPLASTSGGTGVSNAGTITNASNTTITGGGTLALAGFTLTVPATGTAALLGTANVFSENQTVSKAAANTLAITSTAAGVALNLTAASGSAAVINLITNGIVRSSFSATNGNAFYMSDGANGHNPFLYNAGTTALCSFNFTGTLDATSASAASVVLAGGIGVAKKAVIADTTSASSSTVGAVTIGNGVAATNVAIGGGNINAGGTLVVGSTTDSTTKDTGSIVTEGGIAMEKNLIHAQGRGAGITSTATAAGTTTLTSASDEIQTFTGSTTQTIQFPAANLFGAGIAVLYTINNQSSGTVTPTRAGADTFQGGGTTDPVLAGASQNYASNGVSVWLRV